MSRRLLAVVLGALILAPALAASAKSASQQSPVQESGSPINDQGSSFHYRSFITRIAPNVSGLSVQVLEFADRLLLNNHTGMTVTVYGYAGEPYARVRPNGSVQVNTRSPAYYLNQNFYGDVNVPASASPGAVPQWGAVDRTGQFEWHDHRIHWMSPARPPQVKDPGRRTKIFDWRVPIRVGAQRGVIEGELFWVPEEGTKAPVGAIVGFVVIALLGLVLVLTVRRRRGAGGPPPDTGGTPAEQTPRHEAW